MQIYYLLVNYLVVLVTQKKSYEFLLLYLLDNNTLEYKVLGT